MPDADPLLTQQEPRGGYQAIETGGQGVPVETAQTLYSQIREAKAQSQGFCDFVLLFFSLLLGSLVWTIVMAITLTLPLAMIIIGATYFHQCLAEPFIPIFNIVAGCVITINNVMNLIDRFRKTTREPGSSRKPTVIGWITTILNILLLLWFFAGCYWVYHIRPGPKECNHTLYYFSYWLLNAVFLFFGTVVVASAITMCMIMICW